MALIDEFYSNLDTLQECVRKIEADDNWLTFMDFKRALADAVKTYSSADCSRHAKILLARFYIEYLKRESHSIHGDLFQTKDVVFTLTLLASENIVKDIVDRDTGDREMLARVIIWYLESSKDNSASQASEQVSAVLNPWLGLEAQKNRLLKTPEIADMLYGKGVWDIFSMDVSNTMQLSRHLYRMKLPVRTSEMQDSKPDLSNTSFSLPEGDIS